MTSMDDQIANVKASYPTIQMTDTDAKKFISQRAAWFKTSIILCCVYGTFALLLLLIAIFSEQGKVILSGYLMPFTATLIGGILFIVLLLVIQITTFKPSVTNTNTYDGDICPDFWKLQKTPDSILNDSSLVTNKNMYLMQYQCVPDTNVYDLNSTKNGANNYGATDQINVYGQKIKAVDATHQLYNGLYYVNNTAISSPKTLPAKTYLYKNFAGQNGKNGVNAVPSTDGTIGANAGTLNCDVVYPNLLAQMDETNFPDNPNSLRCQYARECGIPWTGVCPNIPTSDI